MVEQKEGRLRLIKKEKKRKKNSSKLNDKAYIEMVRKTIVDVDKLHIVDTQVVGYLSHLYLF